MVEKCEKCGAEKPEMLMPQLEPRALKAVRLWYETAESEVEDVCPNELLGDDGYSGGDDCRAICEPIFPESMGCPCHYGYKAVHAHVGKVLEAQKPEFKPYAAVYGPEAYGPMIGRMALVDSEPSDDGTVKLRSEFTKYSKDCDCGYEEQSLLIPIANEAEALRILRDVCGEDDLIEKVKEYLWLSRGQEISYGRGRWVCERILDFIESEQAKMKATDGK